MTVIVGYDWLILLEILIFILHKQANILIINFKQIISLVTPQWVEPVWTISQYEYGFVTVHLCRDLALVFSLGFSINIYLWLHLLMLPSVRLYCIKNYNLLHYNICWCYI